MKTANFYEFQTLVQCLSEELIGAQLQEVFSCPDGVVLGFYRYHQDNKSIWLVFDIDMQFPFIGYFDHNPWHGLKAVQPTGLFLNAHFKNHYVQDLNLVEKQGRVLEIIFRSESDLSLEFRLIPKQPNLILTAGQKKISWDKVKLISEQDTQSVPETETRSIPFMMRQWLDHRSKAAKSDQIQKQAGQSPCFSTKLRSCT